jgi:hypothetical protein
MGSNPEHLPRARRCPQPGNRPTPRHDGPPFDTLDEKMEGIILIVELRLGHE